MSFKVGLDVSHYDSIDGDLEKAESDSQIRLRNLGKDYLSADKSIVLFNDFSVDRDLRHSSGGNNKAYIVGSGGSAPGDGTYTTGGSERIFYTAPDEFNLGDCAIEIRFNTTFDGNPPTGGFLFYGMPIALNTANQLGMFINNANGNLTLQLRNDTGTSATTITATAEEVNGAGLDWDMTKEIYILISISSANNEIAFYAGRVEDVTTNIKKTGARTNIASDNGGMTFILGGHSTVNGPSYVFSEFVVFDGRVSTAASFTIPAEISKIYATDSPEIVLSEIDLRGTRTIDYSESNLNILTGDVKVQVSHRDVSGSPVYGGTWLTKAQFEALTDTSGRYEQMKAQHNSDGVTQAIIADTGDYLAVGAATPDPPDTPASLAWTDNVDGATGDVDFIIDGDATLTTIEFRREGTTAYSTQTTTDTGAATVTLSGLSVGFYEIRAYSEISGVYSLPSDMIPGQITNTTLAASDNQILIDFGEEILYVPKVGGSRRIWAVVVRDPAEKNSDGTPVKHILIQVDNSDTTGIATDEVNCGFDAVKVDNRRGDTGKEYRIIKPTVQDGDGNMVHYMVK